MGEISWLVPDLNWQLKILLPSLLGAPVVVICFVCFWMRLPVTQRARLCRCCHCYEQNRDPPREERNVFVTEKSPLISNHENDRAVEHEYLGVKGKLNEPVQEEDGDVKGKMTSLEKTKGRLWHNVTISIMYLSDKLSCKEELVEEWS